MRVLFMGHWYPPVHNAGAEWAAHSMFRHLVAGGHEVTVTLNRQPGDPYTLDGVQVHPHQTKRDPFRWIPQWADVVVTHLENTARASVLGDLNRVPVVHLLHNDLPHTRRMLARHPPQLAVFNTHWMRQATPEWAGPSVVVHPPVYAADYATTPGDMVTLVNLWPGKGGQAFWELARRMPEVRFLGVTGGYGEQTTGQAPNVEVIEHVPGHEMAGRVYRRTRILLMPSAYESYGRVGVEAMCSGIPVIAHPTPGLRESLGDTGIFVDRDDLDGWEQTIRRLLDGRRWRAASRRAAAHAATLDPTVELEQFLATLERVVACWPRRR